MLHEVVSDEAACSGHQRSFLGLLRQESAPCLHLAAIRLRALSVIPMKIDTMPTMPKRTTMNA